ncbi:hypothetical protein QFC21_005320 [Naganishia friedmannii]|uniref:Uncharacterized protein n=1 Tax=Naganishia friedmannii TaxID=89922 RepID=A0ACC2VA52_9TREE|nr:hypothetical protein QFC21_005320 [Naganishia friedmannii]
MSTAIVPADHVGGEERQEDVVVVTPDVIEEPKSTTETKPTNELPAAPVKDTTTTPALKHAESAIVTAVKSTAPLAPVAAAQATIEDHTDVVEPALEPHVKKAAAHESVDVSSAPVATTSVVAAELAVPVGNTKTEEVKDVKDVTKDAPKDAKGEKKTPSRSSSSSSADETNTSTATATKTDKPLPLLVTPGTPTVTPATPSKTASPQVQPSTSTTSAAAVVAANQHPVPAKENQVIDVDAVVERVEKIKLAEGTEAKDKDVGRLVVPLEDEAQPVKETHPAPTAVKKIVDASASAAQVEDKKSKPSAGTASPKIHRRISARIGQYIDHKFLDEKKKGSLASSGVAGSGVVTAGDDKGKDKESFVSGSAQPHLATTHTHANTNAAAPTATTEAVGSAPPVLGAPIKVEPMGELEVKDEETVKSATALNP